MAHLKGRIRPEYWITCGLCGDERCLAESLWGKAVRVARQQGYRSTDRFGWVCGNHDRKEISAKTAEAKRLAANSRETGGVGRKAT